jgi:hypothetical protein
MVWLEKTSKNVLGALTVITIMCSAGGECCGTVIADAFVPPMRLSTGIPKSLNAQRLHRGNSGLWCGRRTLRGLHCQSTMKGSGGAAGGERKVAVIGGGLAGLAVSYHLLNMTKSSDMPDYSITIMDESVSDHRLSLLPWNQDALA